MSVSKPQCKWLSRYYMSFTITDRRTQTATENFCAPLMMGILHHLQSQHMNKYVVYVLAYHLLKVVIRLCHQVPHPRVTKLRYLNILCDKPCTLHVFYRPMQTAVKFVYAVNLPPPLWHVPDIYSLRKQ